MEPFYVGKGKGYRYRSHIKPSSLFEVSHKNNVIKQILRSGYEILDCIDIVASNLTEQQSLELEALLIEEIGRRDLGNGTLTNMTDGGENPSNHIPSLDTKQKTSDSLKDYWRNNPDRLEANRGSSNGHSKLSEVDVAEIKKRLSRGAKGSHLAREFNVHSNTISSIKNGKRWGHITL